MAHPVRERTVKLRQPEYTGENRCIPCTVVNVSITAVVALAVGLISRPAGVAAFGLGTILVYYRGYLVPGTPTLTKRYLPDTVLRLFDKHDDPVEFESDVDVETFLRGVDALEECHDGEELCLIPSFREAWHDRIDASNPDTDTDGVAAFFDGLGIDPDRVTVDAYGDAYAASVDGVRVAQWESRAAYLADLAAEATFRERHPDWSRLGYETRTEILGSLRLWLDECPTCGDAVTLDEETVESCCRSIEVIAATCDGCGARVFEAQLSADAVRA